MGGGGGPPPPPRSASRRRRRRRSSRPTRGSTALSPPCAVGGCRVGSWRVGVVGRWESFAAVWVPLSLSLRVSPSLPSASGRPPRPLSGYLAIAFRRVGLKTPGGVALPSPEVGVGRWALGLPSLPRTRPFPWPVAALGREPPLGRPWGPPRAPRLAWGVAGPRVPCLSLVCSVFPVPTFSSELCVFLCFSLAGQRRTLSLRPSPSLLRFSSR